MARPTKLTPELQEQFLDALRRTLYVETASALCGIDGSTFRRWVRRGGGKGGGIYAGFCTAIKKVLAECEADDLDTIKAASAKKWEAAAWRRERRNPERWGNCRREIAELKKALADLLKQYGSLPTPPPPKPPPAKAAGGGK